ncbi:DDE_Tnp_1_7 domain-containing protein [Trichonephila clavata]|uniref:DDE_Tnp_1_7 domain-containing protein n=1 Tax=Trichonephila clavata TaxID=2740835 RepID=A0A8X6M3G4_TRICU|nr:DDE_Tnp_1_7 domain-containing protein [Trichonephila clavata]
MDNWSTSIPSADKLSRISLNSTFGGTIRKNNREILFELLEWLSRSLRTFMYCFDQAKALLWHKTKRNKCIVLLSTFHEKPNINEESG